MMILQGLNESWQQLNHLTKEQMTLSVQQTYGRTSSDRTNRPIAHLYSVEVTTSDMFVTNPSGNSML